jgi:3-hydroxybutyryl-CoA dehydrogenase
MRLVEVVSGPATSRDTARTLFELARRWGKTPVYVRDVPGFIVNRVARPFYGEAFRALGEGVDPAAIDHALKTAAGFRMGPLELADLIGQDINYAAASSIYEAYGRRTRFTPQPAQAELVAAGRLGRKTGRGVYDYGPPLPEPVFAQPGAMAAPLADADGRSARMRATETGGTIALLDWTSDRGAAAVWTFTASGPPQGAARAAAVAGKKALVLPDRPGGIVLRTLAQLANAAADAVADDVAAPADIDAALLHGANYPFGPLAWADRVGAGFVVRALGHIAEETGDPIYAPADLLRRAERSGQRLVS